MGDQDLNTILRELLEEGRQLGISRGGEDSIVARYAARIKPMFDDLHGEVSKLKRKLTKERKAAATAEEAHKSEDTAREAAATEAAATAAAEKPEPAAAPEKRDWRGTWRR